MVNLIYMGDDLYRRSATTLSPIYTEQGERSDWGHVQTALRDGEEISIRQGTEEERNELVGNYIRRGGFWK
jgi:hypothetical protein